MSISYHPTLGETRERLSGLESQTWTLKYLKEIGDQIRDLESQTYVLDSLIGSLSFNIRNIELYVTKRRDQTGDPDSKLDYQILILTDYLESMIEDLRESLGSFKKDIKDPETQDFISHHMSETADHVIMAMLELKDQE